VSADKPFERTRAIAARVQAGLERLYLLERTADVEDFVRSTREGEREVLLVREQTQGDIEVIVRLPRLPEVGCEVELDTLCQIIEGVSHFVYLVERARVGRAATRLEMEVQAEVDKWAVLGASIRSFDAGRSATLRSRLYEDLAFVDDERSEDGQRYRVANDTAHRFVRRLEREYLGSARFGELRAELWRFFHIGQEGKLRLGRAA
jgi:hypothetical protein